MATPKTLEIICTLKPKGASITSSVGQVTQTRPLAVPRDEALVYIEREQAKEVKKEKAGSGGGSSDDDG